MNDFYTKRIPLTTPKETPEMNDGLFATNEPQITERLVTNTITKVIEMTSDDKEEEEKEIRDPGVSDESWNNLAAFKLKALAIEAAILKKLEMSGRCCLGYAWINIGKGNYQCSAGGHTVNIDDL